MKFLKVLLLLTCTFSFAQKGFEINDSKKTVIHFKLINNLIFLPMEINGAKLNFLLDSGVNETILFSLEDKEVNFNNTEKIKFSGLGESMDIEGLKSENNIVTIGKDFRDQNHTVFVILDERINFSSHVGIPVNGIIGYHFFKNHPIDIDYISEKITVYNNSETFKKRSRRYKEFPITIEGNKPYLNSDVEMTNKKVSSKMLLDLGNSDAVWLFPKLIDDFVYNRPNIDDYLGQGFNGDIFGKRSRIHRLYIGDFIFEKPLSAMPDEYSIQNLKLVPNRKGSIGSDILRRFQVIFDYPENKIYLKKNKHFNDPFLFNKSGLDIQQNGMTWQKDLVRITTRKLEQSTNESNAIQSTDNFTYNFVLKPKFSIAGCRKDSPCFIAGMKKGDEIITINKKQVGEMNLEKINTILKAEDGTPITFEVLRDNNFSKTFKIILKDPIPYQDAD